MKFINLLFSLLLFAGFTMAQQVERNQVVVEIGTGTW